MKKSKSIALKIDAVVLAEADELLKTDQRSRNRYINEAVAYYNRMVKRARIREQLQRESKIVNNESVAMARNLEGLDSQLLDQ